MQCPLLLEVMSRAVGGMLLFIGGYVRNYWSLGHMTAAVMSVAIGGCTVLSCRGYQNQPANGVGVSPVLIGSKHRESAKTLPPGEKIRTANDTRPKLCPALLEVKQTERYTERTALCLLCPLLLGVNPGFSAAEPHGNRCVCPSVLGVIYGVYGRRFFVCPILLEVKLRIISGKTKANPCLLRCYVP